MRGALVRIADHIVAHVAFSDETATLGSPAALPLPRVLRRHITRAAKKGTSAVSFVVYAEGASRGKAGVEAVTALVFDFDHLSAEAARGVVAALRRLGWAYLLYTSFSNKLGGDDDICFRVVILLTRPIRPAEYAGVWSAVNSDLGGLADTRARDVARIWFIPCCPPDRLGGAVYEARDGHLLDVDAVLESRVVPDEPAPPPRRPLPPVAARIDQARRVARYRLNHDGEARERVATYLNARVTGNKASDVACPACGRPSVWFWLDPAKKRTASCDHRKSCGWWGFLDSLVDAHGGSRGD